jgi:hypothetical protein
MLLYRLFYVAAILCFMIVHYIALRQIDATASERAYRSVVSQPTD